MENYLASKEDILNLRIEIEKRFNAQLLWIVATGLGIVGLLFTLIKLFTDR